MSSLTFKFRSASFCDFAGALAWDQAVQCTYISSATGTFSKIELVIISLTQGCGKVKLLK